MKHPASDAEAVGDGVVARVPAAAHGPPPLHVLPAAHDQPEAAVLHGQVLAHHRLLVQDQGPAGWRTGQVVA
jgi:hypothetical protein